jgi:DNA-binding transcriptional ArsR family regulator
VVHRTCPKPCRRITVPKTDLNSTLSALADRNRRAVIDLLKVQPRRAGEIADALSLTPPALSRHLRVLRRSGLIHEQGVEQDARIRIYQLRKEPFDELRIWLQDVESFWLGELAAFRDHVERTKGRRKQGLKRK